MCCDYLWIYVWIVILEYILSFPMFMINVFRGLWWCNANPQWFTTYLSVWTGRWSAGCLVVACWCRGVEFLFFMQVSRLGLWSRIVFACCYLTLCFEIVELFCYLEFGEYICILLEIQICLWIICICSAAMWCDMIFMHVCIVVYLKT